MDIVNVRDALARIAHASADFAQGKVRKVSGDSSAVERVWSAPLKKV